MIGGRRASLWAPVALYMALLFGLSSIPHPPEPPAAFATGADKVVHAVLYAGLGALAARALAGGWRRPLSRRGAALAVAISVAYGVSDEIHQHFVPPRQMDAADIVADAAGATLAVWLLSIGPRRRSPPEGGL